MEVVVDVYKRQAQSRILDIGGRHSVVVYHRHADAGEQQVLVLHLLRAVCIHHHQQGVAVHPGHGVMGADESVPVFGSLAHRIYEGLGGVVAHIRYDIVFHSKLPRKACLLYKSLSW